MQRIRKIYNEFPRDFWVLITSLFVDRLGGALFYPFIALFVTAKFQVGMIEVGYLFAIFAIASIFGNTVGGAMTDRFGRRSMIIFGLIISAFSALTLGFVGDLSLLYITGMIVGLFSNIGSPAQQAIIADLLPEERRADGFGLLRIVSNLAMTIGPAIGGILAAQSYLWLFISDAFASTITAFIVFLEVPETKPKSPTDTSSVNMVQAMKGYVKVIRDRVFVAFILISILMLLVYIQMNTTLSVYLRDVHGIPAQGFGYILSLNAGMVVLFQFWITRHIKHLPPLIVMALGTSLYAIGFSMYGIVSSYALFMLAMVIITIGEMFVAPVGQALVANLAPEDMRGRYMAVYGFSWTIPVALGPWAAGLIMDKYDPNWVWYACGIISTIAIAGYLILHLKIHKLSSKLQRRQNGFGFGD
jgi:MFS family permease